jgi:hypothetical protein
MMSPQNGLVLVVAENAPLELAGYGHGDPRAVRSNTNRVWQASTLIDPLRTCARHCSTAFAVAQA